jgi:CRISPR-associated exonuclease Cas4
MLAIAAVLILFALLLLWQARRRQKTLGLPAGRIIYADTSKWGAVEQALYDPELGLTGRPDYLVEQSTKLVSSEIIPVEVKSSRVSAAPYDAHIFQLAAYCLLVQRSFGKRPPFGILHYSNRTFAIDYTPQLETALLDLLDEMRSMDRRKEVARSHQAAARCQGCGYRNTCEQRLRT